MNDAEPPQVEQDATLLWRDRQQLAPQKILFDQRLGYIFNPFVFLILLTIAVPLAWAFWMHWWVLAIIAVCVPVLTGLLVFEAHFWPPIAFRRIWWQLTDDGLTIGRGVLWQHRLAIPAQRVQHVDVSQGPIQRMFDLSTITIHTAGTANASVALEGLEHATAMALRDKLIARKESLDVT